MVVETTEVLAWGLPLIPALQALGNTLAPALIPAAQTGAQTGGILGSSIGAGVAPAVQASVNTAIMTGATEGIKAGAGAYDKPDLPPVPTPGEGLAAREQRLANQQARRGPQQSILSPLARGAKAQARLGRPTILGPGGLAKKKD